MFREEITLALKNGGNIDNIDNYKGIFLRNVILTIFQKCLYRKNAKKVMPLAQSMYLVKELVGLFKKRSL